MRWRLILGPLLALGLAGLLALDAFTGRPAWGLLIVVVLISLRGTWELTHLFRCRSFEIQAVLVQICNLAVLGANWIERVGSPDADLYIRHPAALGPCLLAYVLAFIVLMGSEAARFMRPGNSMESLGAEIFIVSYMGVLLSLTSQMRWVAGADLGYVALGSLIVAAKCGDIGGYFLGKAFGRRKLIERLSPGKTRIGAFGAILGAILGTEIWLTCIAPYLVPGKVHFNLVSGAIYGCVIGFVGLVGDLCESLIKRDTGRKDSAELLPEFGGLLDLVDSVIYAAPVAYLLWVVLPFTK